MPGDDEPTDVQGGSAAWTAWRPITPATLDIYDEQEVDDAYKEGLVRLLQIQIQN